MKRCQTTRRFIRTAFTLIELLVVISIIAILSAVGGPALIGAMRAGKMARAMADARQIGLALRMYSQDHEGTYPSEEKYKTSNDAFRELIPDYIQTESIFAVSGSPVGKKADNKIEPESKILERGENHWAYVAGLGDSSNSMWPLIVDSTDGSGNYTTNEGQPGGLWRGAKTIVVRCDQSSVIVPLGGKGAKRFLPKYDDDQKNALQVREYMGSEVSLLEPAR